VKDEETAIGFSKIYQRKRNGNKTIFYTKDETNGAEGKEGRKHIFRTGHTPLREGLSNESKGGF